MPARKPRPDEKPQFERFIETAREIGAGETDKVLRHAIRRMVRAPVTPTTSPRGSRKNRVRDPEV